MLLAKMNNYRVRGIVHNWFTSYLINRKQYTVIDHNQSELQIITCGIPQGSVLGPLLFLMYVNDIHKAVPDVNVRLFTDDTNMFIHDKNCKTLMQTANENLSKLNDWLTVNKLSLNLNKICYSVYCNDKINDFKIALNGVEIKRVKSCKYLGIIIDDELKFMTYILIIFTRKLLDMLVYFTNWPTNYLALVVEIFTMDLLIPYSIWNRNLCQ